MNIHASTAHRHMANVSAVQRQATSRLSSGFRINSAADDAAGLAISNDMRAQIRGLNQAVRNTQDAVSLIQVAEGGMSAINSMIKRMRELVVQASNDTYLLSDRQKIQIEIDQLVREVDSTANRLQFNSITLLNGSLARSASSTVASLSASIQPVSAVLTPPWWWYADPGFIETIPPTPQDIGSFNDFFNLNRGYNFNIQDMLNDFAAGVMGAGYDFDDWLRTRGPTESGLVDGVSGNWSFYELGGFAAVVTYAYFVALDVPLTFLWSPATAPPPVRGSYTGILGGELADFWAVLNDWTAQQRLLAISGQCNYACLGCSQFVVLWSAHIRGPRLEFNPPLPTTPPPLDPRPPVYGGTLHFQIGGNAKNSKFLNIESMTSIALGLRNAAGGITINVAQSSGRNISALIPRLDNALKFTTIQRAKLGASQNRLEHTSRSLLLSSENLTDSESRIRDADIAKEKLRHIKANILQQAATSMLSNANQHAELVISLLR